MALLYIQNYGAELYSCQYQYRRMVIVIVACRLLQNISDTLRIHLRSSARKFVVLCGSNHKKTLESNYKNF